MDDWIDQVVRRKALEATFPDVVIEHKEDPGWHWVASWPQDGGQCIVVESELEDLLDHLERDLRALGD
jgi:hypothetical protein